MSEITQNISKVIDVYLYNELYKRGIIKSKSFNFSNSLSDVRSKIMYIVKSLAINAIKTNELELIFTKTFFERDRLSLNYNINYNVLCDSLSYYYIKNYIENNECRFASVGNFRLDFLLDEVHTIFTGNLRSLIDIKEILNGVINNILFIQSAICDIGLQIKTFRSSDTEELSKLKNMQYLAFGLFGARHIETKRKIAKLKALENKDEIFELSIDIGTSVDTRLANFEIRINELHKKYILGQSTEDQTSETINLTENNGLFIVLNGVTVPLQT